MKLRAEDVETSAVSPEDVAELANRLGRADSTVLDELNADLERSAAPASSTPWPPILEEPRRRMDTRYADPATSHRPLVGTVLVAAKRGFRLAFQPFINEMLRRQVEFNEAILTSLAGIYEQVRVNARTQALWRDEVERRLAKLESSKKPARKKR